VIMQHAYAMLDIFSSRRDIFRRRHYVKFAQYNVIERAIKWRQ